MTPEELKLAQTIYRQILDDSADNLDRNEGWLAYGLMLKHIDDQAAQIETLKRLLIEERASKTIGKFCNCETCWPLGEPESKSRIEAKEKIRHQARQQLEAAYPEAMK